MPYIGDAKDSWPYMTGEWSTKYGVSAMPFDAILVSSRIMVCKEAGTDPMHTYFHAILNVCAATALEAKELLVKTPGVEVDSQWEESYDGVAGGNSNQSHPLSFLIWMFLGIMTVTSELGEPIHKVPLLTLSAGHRPVLVTF